MRYLLVLAAIVGAAVLLAHFEHGVGDHGRCPANQVAYNGGC